MLGGLYAEGCNIADGFLCYAVHFLRLLLNGYLKLGTTTQSTVDWHVGSDPYVELNKSLVLT